MRSPWSQAPPISPSIYSEHPEQQQEPPRRHRPFSSFFNGTSTVNRGQAPQPSNASVVSTPRMPRPFMTHANGSTQSVLTPNSLLSMMVGPTAPPSSGSHTHSTASFNGGGLRGLALPARAHVLDYGGNVPVGTEPYMPRDPSPASKTTGSHRRKKRHHEPRWVPRHSRGKVWFPALESMDARKKFFHACVSGTLLAIILIVCT